MKLNLDKLTKLTKDIWLRIGQKISIWIYEDAQRGKFQNDAPSQSYRSESYKRYKANNMRRFTVGEGQTFSDKEGYYFGKTYFRNKKAGFSKKKGFGTGERLKGYKGVSIESGETSFVNLILTGQMFRGLKPISSDEMSVTMSYAQKDAGKVLGAKRFGRIITSLNKSNIEKVKEELVKEYDKHIKEGLPKKVTIIVSNNKIMQ